MTGMENEYFQMYLLDNGEISDGTDKTKLNDDRKDAIEKLEAAFHHESDTLSLQEILWEAIVQFQGFPFETARHLQYTYSVKGNEIFFSRKDKSITRSTVNIAFANALEIDRIVSGPKKLGVFGSSYLYPIFMHLKVIMKEAPEQEQA